MSLTRAGAPVTTTTKNYSLQGPYRLDNCCYCIHSEFGILYKSKSGIHTLSAWTVHQAVREYLKKCI